MEELSSHNGIGKVSRGKNVFFFESDNNSSILWLDETEQAALSKALASKEKVKIPHRETKDLTVEFSNAEQVTISWKNRLGSQEATFDLAKLIAFVS